MSNQQSEVANSRFPWGIALSIAIPTFYLLSYAPVVRWLGPPAYSLKFEPLLVGRVDLGGLVLAQAPTVEVHYMDGDRLPLYQPVDSLIDNSPLREPLLFWADMLDVGRDFRCASDERRAST